MPRYYRPSPAPPFVRFPAASTIARLDLKVTSMLASILPARLLLVPAHMFGAPLMSLIALPSLLAVLLPVQDSTTTRWPGCVALACVGITGGGGLQLLRGKPPHDKVFHKGAHIPAGAAAILVGLKCVNPAAFAAACLYLIAWAHATAIAWLLKGFISRPRPALWLQAAASQTSSSNDGPSTEATAPPSSPSSSSPASRRRLVSFGRSRECQAAGEATLAAPTPSPKPLQMLSRDELVAEAAAAEAEADAEQAAAVAAEQEEASRAAREAVAAQLVLPPPSPRLERIYEERLRWSADAVGAHSVAPNSLHSFPSFDAAAAGCFVGAARMAVAAHAWVAAPSEDIAPLPATLPAVALVAMAALALLGRVAFFAHHVLDVAGGFALGLGLASAFGALAPPSMYGSLLLWLPVAPLLLGAFFTGRPRPLIGAAVMLGLTLGVAPLHPSLLCMPAAFALVLALIATGFRAQCRRLHAYALAHVDSLWRLPACEPPAGLLSPALLAVLHRKRNEVRAHCGRAHEAFAFPANLYLIGNVYALPFGATWDGLESLMRRRLLDWAVVTQTPLDQFDVVLGVLTGGALLAPMCARMLGIPSVCHVRISRYQDDLYSPAGLARVVVSQLLGSHEQQYKLSEAPDEALLRGKRVLILDDALASGGTLRAAYTFCMRAGAASAHGVALKIIGGYFSEEDFRSPSVRRGPRRHAARELRLPSFTPWGTF